MPVTTAHGDAYPTIQEIFDQTRVLINDTFKGATSTWGEGRVFTNDWTPNITTLNMALQALQRDLEDRGVKTTKEEIFLARLPALNGPLGLAVPDPSVQVYLDINGWWDGSTLHNEFPSPSRPDGGPMLPLDMLMPLRIEERNAGSNLNYQLITEAENGLPSIYQTLSLGQWEWRGDAIYFNGALTEKDIRIRYRATKLPKFPKDLLAKLQPPQDFNNVYIPYSDTGDALAYRCAYIFSSARLPAGGANELLANYKEQMNTIANRTVKQMQRSRYCRIPPVWNSGSYWGGP